jgi:hypothetical protein
MSKYLTSHWKYKTASVETIMHYMDTKLKYGKHQGEIVSDVLKINPTYIPFMYHKYEEFYISELVWNSLNVHKEFEDMLSNMDEKNKKELEDLISKNRIFHEEKIKKYKTIFIMQMESKLKYN